ncbi:MAG TPA: DUF72 domain-containing protein [bacterium]|nr:DUF72 domain-containing protein [bacterium]HOL66599.1 DUF72 domain-containing protein [bacterium]HPP11900.1 DUF72 domain-containing protein [bacterium]
MIRVGTCSWADRSILESGSFYPKKIKSAQARLTYYASRFDTVEVDATYYAIPAAETASLWVQRTPENFLFHVKAYAALTGHTVDPKTLPEQLRQMLPERERDRSYTFIHDPGLTKELARLFGEAIKPLAQAGKLGLVVFQFPPWFRYSLSSLNQILTCRRMVEGFSMGVEFRHASWLKEEKRQEVFSFLRAHGLTYIAADEPQLADDSTVPFVPEATTDTVYFRLHGRNASKWHLSGIKTSLRYDYLYSDEELQEFCQAAQGFAEKNVFVMFNNCHAGQAMRNALRLKALLRGEELPEESASLF